jgi:cob(I)alamin adenosyltransferase
MFGKGLIHYYYGYGKGKTTAALGLAMRAAGCGCKVVLVHFLKDWNCGELDSFKLLPNVTVLLGKATGSVFVRDMTDEQKAETKAIHDENLRKALELQINGQCDLLVLDEASDAYMLGVLDSGLLRDLLDNKPETMELVVTGHDPEPMLLERADYVTEMVKHKHPYDKGVESRRGIEF